MNESVLVIGAGSGLSASLARELHTQNIHIGHFIIGGRIGRQPHSNHEMIHPDSIAKTYLEFHYQDPSAWSWEIELRTWKEKF